MSTNDENEEIKHRFFNADTKQEVSEEDWKSMVTLEGYRGAVMSAEHGCAMAYSQKSIPTRYEIELLAGWVALSKPPTETTVDRAALFNALARTIQSDAYISRHASFYIIECISFPMPHNQIQLKLLLMSSIPGKLVSPPGFNLRLELTMEGLSDEQQHLLLVKGWHRGVSKLSDTTRLFVLDDIPISMLTVMGWE